jgi:WD40 repeat protein
VKRAAKDWETSGRNSIWLIHRGTRLTDAKSLSERADLWAKFDALDQVYLVSCEKSERDVLAKDERIRKEREEARLNELRNAEELAAANRRAVIRTRAGLVAALFLMATAGLIAWYANAEKQNAQLRQSELLTRIAREKATAFDNVKAASLSLQALAILGNGFKAQRQEIGAVLYDALLNNRELADIVGQREPISDAAFNPTGTLIASVAADSIWIWDASSGKLVKRIMQPNRASPNTFRSVNFTRDGERLLAIEVGGAAILDIRSGKSIARFDADLAWFNYDGSYLVTSTGEETYVIDPETNEQLLRLSPIHSRVIVGEFSQDGKSFALSDEDGFFSVWNIAEKRLVMRAQLGKVATLIAFSENGDRVAVASNDGWYQVININGGWTANGNAITNGLPTDAISIVFEPQAESVVITSRTAGQILWDYQNNTTRIITRSPTALLYSSVSPDGKSMVSTYNDGNARIFSIASGEQQAVLAGHSGPVTYACFSADGKRVLTASADKTIRIWDNSERKPGDLIANVGEPLVGASISVNHNLLALLGKSGVVNVLSIAPPHTLVRVPGTFASLAFDDTDEARLALGTSDGRVEVFEFTTGGVTATFKADSAQINSVAFGSKSHLIITGSDSGVVALWRLANGTWSLDEPIAKQDFAIRTTVIGPSGENLVFTTYGDVIAAVDLALHTTWMSKSNIQTNATAVSSTDQTAFVSNTGVFQICDTLTSDSCTVIDGNLDLQAISFDQSDVRMLTVTRDGMTRIWAGPDFLNNYEPGTNVSRGIKNVFWAGFSSEPASLTIVCKDGLVFGVHQFFTFDDLVKYAKEVLPRTIEFDNQAGEVGHNMEGRGDLLIRRRGTH